jgi:hypothetical protein
MVAPLEKGRATIVAVPAITQMNQPKTRLTRASAGKFLSSIKDPKRREDCRTIAAIMKQVTRANPRMWGSGIVGFGTRTIKYAGGREAEWMRIAFAPRKDRIALTDVHLPTLRKLAVQSIRNVD